MHTIHVMQQANYVTAGRLKYNVQVKC